MTKCEDSTPCKGMESKPCHRFRSPYWSGRLPQSNDQGSPIDSSKSADTTVAQANSVSVSSVNGTTLNEELITAKKLYLQSKLAIVEMFSEARMGHAIAVSKADELVDHIARSISRHPNAFISLVRLKNATEYTYMHSVAVCALMIAVAHQLDFSEELIHQAGLAGLLHDIGKMAIAGAILNKPGKLTDDEFLVIRQHPQRGAQILRASGPLCEAVVDVCLHHHERMDGSGYPDRLSGEQISLFSRMAAICDVYDAVTSDRPYNEAWSPAIAIQKMSGWKRHFDHSIFHAFVKSIGIYPVGSIVRLCSGNIGVIIEQNPGSLLMPKVKIFFSTTTNAYITPTIIDMSRTTPAEKIIECVLAEQYGFKHIEALWNGPPVNS